MTREIELCSYLPEVIRNVREYQVLCNVQTPQVNAMWKALEVVFDNGFLESLTEYGCQRWEKILQLTPDKSESLEIRRKNIWIRLNENLPYTFRRLVMLMDSICGKNGYTMTLYHNDYFLDVSIQLTEQNLESHIVKQVMELFERVLPANIEYIKKFRYDAEDTSVKVGATTVIAQVVDVLPLMPSNYQNEAELYTDGVLCVGLSAEIKEG
jgi:hypothetical protein